MARRRSRSRARRYYAKSKRSSPKMTLPLGLIGGVIATPAIGNSITLASQGKYQMAVRNLSQLAGVYQDTGIFDSNLLMSNLKPMLAGVIAHKIAGFAGVNRALARAKVPWVRI